MTWGEAYGNPLEGATSTATTALGHLMSKQSFLGAGLHGTTPSGTSLCEFAIALLKNLG